MTSLPLRIFRVFTVVLWVFCTLLLWLPDPRILFFHMDIPEEPGYGYEHLIMFSVLSFCVLLSWTRKSVVSWTAVLLLYALLTEIVQIPIPYRTFEWIDLLEDGIGIAIGLAVASAVRVLRKKSNSSTDP